MVAYVRGLRDFNDAFFRQPPRGRAEVLAALTNHTGGERRGAVRGDVDARFLTPTAPSICPASPTRSSGGSTAARFASRDVAQLDGSYLDYAVGRLGRYQP